MLGFLREGDTLIVTSLDQLGRSVQNLIVIVPGLRKRGLAVDMTTPPQPSRSSPANSPRRAPTRALTLSARAAPASDDRRPRRLKQWRGLAGPANGQARPRLPGSALLRCPPHLGPGTGPSSRTIWGGTSSAQRGSMR
ncbi:recombinase family protein [Streptomyces niveus]|uniref:recombinase family protein n=1 Tax=Streptomyces niveus TaxID=193462 RepID=UPI003D04ABDA